MEIRIEALTKHYGDTLALDHFTVDLQPGIYGFLGPNGAGKSTLLNLLTDTLKRESGKILLDGQDVLKLGKAYREKLGYMPQQQGYYDEFSVARFLYYMAALKGIPRRQAGEEIRRLLGVVGLSDCMHKKMGALSGGMRQRVLLVQALLGNPDILLLDEPTAGLDPEERIRIRNHISAIAADKVVLLATHLVSDIESIAGEVILIKKGRLLGKDTPGNLIEAVRPYISELYCTQQELAQTQKERIVSNISQHNGEYVLRIVQKEPVKDPDPHIRVGLDEVYLYYMNCLD